MLPNTSRSKGNQTRKFGQLIEYNMRNIFLEKSYTKFDGETNPRPFSKQSKCSILVDQQSDFYTLCFYCMSKSKTTKLPHIELFLKKKRSGTSLPVSFILMIFENYFSCFIPVTD